MTIWVPGGIRIKGIDSSMRIRFLFMIRKIIFSLKIIKKGFARRLKKNQAFYSSDILGLTKSSHFREVKKDVTIWSFYSI